MFIHSFDLRAVFFSGLGKKNSFFIHSIGFAQKCVKNELFRGNKKIRYLCAHPPKFTAHPPALLHTLPPYCTPSEPRCTPPNLAAHPPNLAAHPPNLAAHPPNLAAHPPTKL